MIQDHSRLHRTSTRLNQLTKIFRGRKFEKIVIQLHHVCPRAANYHAYARKCSRQLTKASKLIEGVSKHYPGTQTFDYQIEYPDCMCKKPFKDAKPLEFILRGDHGDNFAGEFKRQSISSIQDAKNLTELHVAAVSAHPKFIGFECARDVLPKLSTMYIRMAETVTEVADYDVMLNRFLEQNAAMWLGVPVVNLTVRPRQWTETLSNALKQWENMQSLKIELDIFTACRRMNTSNVLDSFRSLPCALPDCIQDVSFSVSEVSYWRGSPQKKFWTEVLEALAKNMCDNTRPNWTYSMKVKGDANLRKAIEMKMCVQN